MVAIVCKHTTEEAQVHSVQPLDLTTQGGDACTMHQELVNILDIMGSLCMLQLYHSIIIIFTRRLMFEPVAIMYYTPFADITYL